MEGNGKHPLSGVLDAYQAAWLNDEWAADLAHGQAEIVARFRTFAEIYGMNVFAKEIPGHITGSAMVANSDLSRVLLTLHARLGKWLQLGGHSDGHPVPAEVARREAEEESGLRVFSFVDAFGRMTTNPIPFDLDIHTIPARPTEPSHDHYDVRYLLIAHDETPPRQSDESLDLRWFTLAEARATTDEESMHRQLDKMERLCQRRIRLGVAN